jgi:hypothetical protein
MRDYIFSSDKIAELETLHRSLRDKLATGELVITNSITDSQGLPLKYILLNHS